MIRRMLAVAALMGATSLAAQQTTAAFPPTVGDTSVFAPLWLTPSPSSVRTPDGAPGAKYWQNRADYTISATVDTGKMMVSGNAEMRYTNHSPDTLHFVWVYVEQNIMKDGALGSYVFAPTSRFSFRGFAGGYISDSVKEVVSAKGAPVKLASSHTMVQGTMMRVDLAKPLAPGGMVALRFGWHFLVPEHGADRMGRDGKLYELAQWYPRALVYDDVRGWNIDEYLGQGEFYLEYGDYDVKLTVPAGYIVASTGMLANPLEVLTPHERSQLSKAVKSDSVLHIVTQAELANGSARPKTMGTLTWHFTAQNVRDVAMAMSPDYLWDAKGWAGILAQSYYRNGAASWTDAADQAAMSIHGYSDHWFKYPWPQVSVVEGPISGMEYPMLAMETASRNVQGLYNVITHEVGHDWFPMIVGSNERMYAFMDEGFNTFINTFSEAERYPAQGDQMTRAAGERRQISQGMASARLPLPIIVNADRDDGGSWGTDSYVKPSVGLQQLRQEILGPEVFDQAFREYIRRWAFKHPTPADFFRTMEQYSGKRLDWFWRPWIFENARYDAAVDTVTVRPGRGDTITSTVVFSNRGRGVLPIRARLTFSDGSTQDVRFPGEVWGPNTARYSRPFTTVKKSITKVEYDPDQLLVDANRTNNVWPKPAPAGGRR